MASPSSQSAISPTRTENYPEWYQQVIRAADLAENSPVRGCMVIKPWGYALWENMQRALDAMFKATGHVNAYFPLFIPMSYLEKEAEHVEGFAKECAVVTHSRLETGPDGRLRPAPESKLEEPLIVRPTSETIIGEMFSRWTQSYRDLPLLINQWANVVRWEMRTRLFLRTAEFLWQEGHTVHATREEAVEETERMLGVYAKFAREWMAMPVITGRKTEGEKFPGADTTLCIEAMMQDRKALQAGTSHFLGQNFARASNIQFLNESGEKVHAWTTSWGVSTRLVGGLIMTHADDDGMVVPPRIAPSHVVILPVTHKEETRTQVLEYCGKLRRAIEEIDYHGAPVRVEIDDRDLRGGEKVWGWIKKGIPLRLEVGPRDMEKDAVFMGRRDRAPKEKTAVPRQEFLNTLPAILDEIQDELFERAMENLRANSRLIDSEEAFREFFTARSGEEETAEIHGGFAWAHWNGSAEVEARAAKELKVSIRCIPDDPSVVPDGQGGQPGKCIFTGEPSQQRVLFAKAY